MMTSTIRKFGVGVASLAMVAGASAPAMAAPDGFDPSPFFNVENLRVSGADRVGTAIAYAKTAFAKRTAFGGKAGERVAYIAGYDNPADSATAGALGGPIFLAKADGSSNKDVAAAMNFLNVDKVVALGGEKAVPQEVLTAIAKAAGDATALRAGGEDRYSTSVAIAERWSDINGQFTPGKVVLANGITLVDALTAGTLKWPILLVDEQGKLPKSVMDYLDKVKPLDYITVGGEKVVPEQTVKNAQATSLKSDEVSTDDSLPILRGKREHWTKQIEGGTYDGRSYRGFRNEARAAADLSAKADEKAQEAWNSVARAAKDLGAEIVEAYKLSNESHDALPGPAGKSWADFMVSPDKYNSLAVAAKRNDLQDAINAAYATDKVDLTNKGDVLSYLRITKSGVTVNKDALAKKFVDGAVEEGTKAADAYYRDNQATKSEAKSKLERANALGYLIMAEESTDTSLTYGPEAKTYLNLGVNAFQVAGVAAHAKALTAGNLVSAENTLRAINLKIAGVQDQLDGKSYWRIAGKDRYGTAAGISARLNNLANKSMDAEEDAGTVKKIYLVNGAAFADATVAGATFAPVLLIAADGVAMPKVTTNEIIRAAKDYREANRLLEVWAVGGSKVVSNTALADANATAVIAQKDQYKARGPVKAVDNTKYSVDNVTTYVNNTAGTTGTPVTFGDAEFVLTGTPEFTISKGSNKWVATADGNNDRPGVGVSGGKIQVKTASNTPVGTYDVSFKVNGKDVSFQINVVSNVYALSGTLSDKIKLYGAGTALNVEGYDLKNNGVQASDLNDFEIKVTKWTDLAGVEHKNPDADKAPVVDLNSGKIRFTAQSGNGTQALGTFEYTIALKSSVQGKVLQDTTTGKKLSVAVELGAAPTPVVASNATGDSAAVLTGVKPEDMKGDVANSGTMLVLDPNTGLLKANVQLEGVLATNDTTVNVKSGKLVTGDVIVVVKDASTVSYKLTVL